MLVLGGVEHDDALSRAACDPDALHRTPDQLALVSHQHDLIAVLDRDEANSLPLRSFTDIGTEPFAPAPVVRDSDQDRRLAFPVSVMGRTEFSAADIRTVA